MEHIDQKILELYVLNDESVRPQRDRIDCHLAECAGCRELYARMGAMYAEFSAAIEDDTTFEQSPDHRSKLRRSLSLTTTSPLQEIHANYEIDRYPLRRLSLFVGKHKIAAGSVSIFYIGLLVLLIMRIIPSKNLDDYNPSYYRYSPESKIEVYSNKNVLLWSIPGYNLTQVANEERERGSYFTDVVDINSDGINEVLTVLQLKSDKEYYTKLQVFDYKGTLVNIYSPNDRYVQFRDVQYDRKFNVGNLFTLLSSNQVDIYLMAQAMRSPSILLRLNNKFDVIGKYWHFGQFTMRPVDIDNDGEKEIVLTGKNDVQDMINGDFSFLAILNPAKIIGETEASTTRGFNHKESNAEMYYIRFPETDMEKATSTKSMARFVHYEDTSYLNINVAMIDNNIGSFNFEYIFNKIDMSVKEIKYGSDTPRLHQSLKDRGLIISDFNKQYLTDLKNRVEYWDGNKWTKQAVRSVQ